MYPEEILKTYNKILDVVKESGEYKILKLIKYELIKPREYALGLFYIKSYVKELMITVYKVELFIYSKLINFFLIIMKHNIRMM